MDLFTLEEDGLEIEHIGSEEDGLNGKENVGYQDILLIIIRDMDMLL